MNLIWFNTDKDYYQSGTLSDLNKLKASNGNGGFLVLEKFHNAPLSVVAKVATELNKCRRK